MSTFCVARAVSARVTIWTVSRTNPSSSNPAFSSGPERSPHLLSSLACTCNVFRLSFLFPCRVILPNARVGWCVHWCAIWRQMQPIEYGGRHGRKGRNYGSTAHHPTHDHEAEWKNHVTGGGETNHIDARSVHHEIQKERSCIRFETATGFRPSRRTRVSELPAKLADAEETRDHSTSSKPTCSISYTGNTFACNEPSHANNNASNATKDMQVMHQATARSRDHANNKNVVPTSGLLTQSTHE